MTFVVLGLGSNKSWQNMTSVRLLARAVQEICAVVTDVHWSSVYKTAPMYLTEQTVFYNMVVVGFVPDTMQPQDLLNRLHQIEMSLGRDRSREVRNGPRSIDIDIELFGSASVHSEDLEIPHPRFSERAFVLVPLLEILNESADIIDSTLCARKTEFAHMLEVCGSGGVELYLPAENFALLR
ncbi:MAG: 2-amino-4-hydroxy-6-hydroxymethyldihydropteridine diphosphokinase [Treponema sp.]|nr:2-amino-4-hydroxy-6-hydroxymethyldihydropteridine diphosphokinase [Treponema sp.]